MEGEALGLSAQERGLLDSLTANEVTIIRAENIVSALGVTKASANMILSRLAKKAWLQRMRRGEYTLVPLGSPSAEANGHDAWILACDLFKPCFISGWSASEHWSFTEQIFNAVSLVTSHRQKHAHQNIAGTEFRVRTLPPEKIFGTKKIWIGSHSVLVADPHRLIVDILDAPDFGGGGRHVVDVVRAYWNSNLSEPQKLLEYASKIGRGTIFKRLGFLAEKYGKVNPEWLVQCRSKISAGVSKLDPDGTDKGPIETKWNLRINLPLKDL